MKNKNIYLDYAAQAPMLPSVRKAVFELEGEELGNPSSIHSDGVAAAKVLQKARKMSADILRAHADEVFFVGSGTESDNLAILGVVDAARATARAASVHIITTAIEHPAVLEVCKNLKKVEITYLPVNQDGQISLEDLRSALRKETVLVTIGYVNSEIGTIQDIRGIAKEIRRFKKNILEDTNSKYPIFHTDACQAMGYLNVNVEQLGVDLLSANGTKIGGPKGVGLLYKKRNTPIFQTTWGGGQENGLRSGTENVSGILGFALALSLVEKNKVKEAERLTSLRDRLAKEIQTKLPQARLNGSLQSRVPNNLNISLSDISSELLVLELDSKGIRTSAGSACSGTKDLGSHVLSALYGAGDEKKWGTVRFSMGKNTTASDLKIVINTLLNIVKKYKNIA